MGGGIGPKRTIAGLIGRLTQGQPISEAEVERLPDPELFRDAIFLWQYGTWTPSELDNADARLVALVRKLQGAKRG